MVLVVVLWVILVVGLCVILGLEVGRWVILVVALTLPREVVR